MYRNMLSIMDINNGRLSAVKAMPQKDSTSDGTSGFEMARRNYAKTLPAQANTVAQNLEKKWSGNRDSSTVMERRKATAVGLGSLNAGNQPLSFTTTKDINVTRDALTRVRAGGAVAPAKKGANRNNAPTPIFLPAKSLENHLKYPVLYH
jgi:hypothetical protein